MTLKSENALLLPARHSFNLQDIKISFEYVDFYAKIFLILYSLFKNSTTRIAIGPSLNRRPLCTTFTFENVSSPKKPKIPKKLKEKKRIIFGTGQFILGLRTFSNVNVLHKGLLLQDWDLDWEWNQKLYPSV